MEGIKYDTDKPDLEMLFKYFPRALMEVARVSSFGAQKYEEGNWIKLDNAKRRYSSAGLRHRIKQYIEGPYDKESNLLHKGHEAWNALAVLELEIKELEEE